MGPGIQNCYAKVGRCGEGAGGGGRREMEEVQDQRGSGLEAPLVHQTGHCKIRCSFTSKTSACRASRNGVPLAVKPKRLQLQSEAQNTARNHPPALMTSGSVSSGFCTLNNEMLRACRV